MRPCIRFCDSKHPGPDSDPVHPDPDIHTISGAALHAAVPTEINGKTYCLPFTPSGTWKEAGFRLLMTCAWFPKLGDGMDVKRRTTDRRHHLECLVNNYIPESRNRSLSSLCLRSITATFL